MQMTAAPARSATREYFSPTRVVAIVSAVARFGTLTSTQVAEVDGGSRQKVIRYLQHIVDDLKLLRRVDRGPEPFLTTFFDTRPRAFAVTAKGLRVLASAGIIIPVSPKRGDVLIAHEVETAAALLAIGASVGACPTLRLIDQPEMIAAMPSATRNLRRPLRLKPVAYPRDFPAVRDLLPEPLTIGVEPDRLVAIAEEQNGAWLGASFAIELDRGGEPISTKRLRGRATWARKTIGYVAAWTQGLHIEQWGDTCKSFRVLVITPSRERAHNIIELQRAVGTPPGLFAFTTPDKLREHGALAPIWLTAKRDGVALLDRE
jgi:hypothetical protein